MKLKSLRKIDIDQSLLFPTIREQVVVKGCRSCQTIIRGPDWGQDKFEWFSRGFKFTQPTEENPDRSIQEGYPFTRVYEWRLNLVTGEVEEKSFRK
ncbi:hypothetical protein Ddye_007772 [Dipteronia dyeriana]|uniref:Uncharacterized protein n=1 Tax=Dipteronia dyeriana TaxID=168575 RepID=A0AAE0CS01_9ROSI|nr:hypothetical protein Ddye_007772 [Dipteronia dyeriana]